jgi:glycosyltransferase involved in cell wall biosynthesis
MINSNNNKKISVVIPSVNGLPIVKECLESIYRQKNSNIAEVIVVDCSNEKTRRVISETFKEIILIHPHEKKTIPELRSIGMKAAKTDILVMIEDHCLVHENWFTEILKAHDSDYIAIGGAVENACCDRVLDWATFFCEYSSFIQPVSSGIVRDLPGNNVSYKRSEIIRLLGESIDEGFWEGFLHRKLTEQGYELLSNPSIIVYHKKAFGFLEFLLQRFYYSRSFAGMRNIEFSFTKRIVYSAFCLLLPFLLMLRLCLRVLSKGRLRKEFALSIPFLFAFTIVWAIGEYWGYLFGAGNSLSHIK